MHIFANIELAQDNDGLAPVVSSFRWVGWMRKLSAKRQMVDGVVASSIRNENYLLLRRRQSEGDMKEIAEDQGLTQCGCWRRIRCHQIDHSPPQSKHDRCLKIYPSHHIKNGVSVSQETCINKWKPHGYFPLEYVRIVNPPIEHRVHWYIVQCNRVLQCYTYLIGAVRSHTLHRAR